MKFDLTLVDVDVLRENSPEKAHLYYPFNRPSAGAWLVLTAPLSYEQIKFSVVSKGSTIPIPMLPHLLPATPEVWAAFVMGVLLANTDKLPTRIEEATMFMGKHKEAVSDSECRVYLGLALRRG